jgi:hypothetical protein
MSSIKGFDCSKLIIKWR